MGWVYAKSNSLGLSSANQPTIFGLQVTESPNQRDFSSKGFLWVHVIRVWKCLQNPGKVWKCLQAQLEPQAWVMLSALFPLSLESDSLYGGVTLGEARAGRWPPAALGFHPRKRVIQWEQIFFFSNFRERVSLAQLGFVPSLGDWNVLIVRCPCANC